MKILLLDNAIDSLEWALRHLTTFLKKDAQFNNPEKSITYLKQVILCLNSALELFFKAKIRDIIVNAILFCPAMVSINCPKTATIYAV